MSVYIPLIVFLVVWGIDEVMLTLASQIELMKVDFPDEGLPIIDTVAHLVMTGIILQIALR